HDSPSDRQRHVDGVRGRRAGHWAAGRLQPRRELMERGAAKRGGGLRPRLRAATRLGAVVAVDDVHAAAAGLAWLSGAAFGLALADRVYAHTITPLPWPVGEEHPQRAVRWF